MAEPTIEQLQQAQQDLEDRLGPGLHAAIQELEPFVHGPEQWQLQPEVHRATAEQHRRLSTRLNALRLLVLQRRNGGKPAPWWPVVAGIIGLPLAFCLGICAVIAGLWLVQIAVVISLPVVLVWALLKPRRRLFGLD